MKGWVTLSRFFSWLALALVSSLLLISASAFLYLSPSLPSVESLKDIHLQTPLKVYSQDNKLIAEFGEKRRTPIRLQTIPQALIQAFITAEDDRFYAHPGVDVVSLTRAALQLVTTGRIQSGGSTITMQVAKNFFLSRERVFSRKFNEILLALQIERQLTKEEILALYLNKIYLGNRAYGVEAAAQVYYGKTVNELSLAQMAMIAGLPKAPSRYNPLNNPSRAERRRDWILRRMQDLGYITQSQYEEAVFSPITAQYHGSNIELQAPYIAEMVRQKMVEQFGTNAYTDGLKVYTTIDSTLQETANIAVANGLIAYTERHGYKGPLMNLKEQGMTTEDQWRELLSQAKSLGPLIPAVVINTQTQHVDILLKEGEQTRIDWRHLNWAKPYIDVNTLGEAPVAAEDILHPGDLIWVRQTVGGHYRLGQEPTAQSALVSLNPNDGALLALVGGFNFYDSMYNRATQAVRQAGSAFKPFIYSAALAHGLTAATIINDAPVVFDDDGLEEAWRPNNDNMRFNGPMRLREGLYRSRNLVSIRILRQIGVNATVSYLQQLGFQEKSLTHNLSLALGNVSVTPLELASGYAVLANGGYQITPYFIEHIETAEGIIFAAEPAKACHACDRTSPETIQKAEQEVPMESGLPNLSAQEPIDTSLLSSDTASSLAEPVMEPRVNYIINDILNDVIWKGTGRRAKALGRHDIGGKTGTTNDNKDAWFAGFNPDILTCVWVGMDNYSTLGRWEYGGNTALPLWLEYMRVALKGRQERKLPEPDGLVTLKINPKTGKLAHQNDHNALFEKFREEYAPVATSEVGRARSSDTDQPFSPTDLF